MRSTTGRAFLWVLSSVPMWDGMPAPSPISRPDPVPVLFKKSSEIDILPRLKPWDSNSRKKHCLFLRRASPSVASGLQHMPQPWPLGYSASFVHGHRLRRILRVYRRAPSPFRRTDVCVRWLNVLVICFKIQSRRDILSRMLLYRSYTVPAPAGTLQSL